MKITNSYYYNQQEGDSRNTNNQLGKDEFLKILITQLRYQDPLNPMEDKDFIAQMAQFSTLEQMQNLNSDFSKMRALDMVGKMIYAEKIYPGTSEITPIIGRVQTATFSNGEIILNVGGVDITVDDIIEIYSEDVAKRIEDSMKPKDSEDDNDSTIPHDPEDNNDIIENQGDGD